VVGVYSWMTLVIVVVLVVLVSLIRTILVLRARRSAAGVPVVSREKASPKQHRDCAQQDAQSHRRPFWMVVHAGSIG
jgi:hypothetical protein